jgi:nitrite reductase/ring-hydroxylating ferredoxin subunit
MIFVLSEDFVKVSDTKDIQPSQMKAVEVGGEIICVVNVEGKYYAIDNICTHEGGPLADGTLEGYEVECPWHTSKFDVRTGEVTNPPASAPEQAYEVKVEGNNILVKKRIITIEQEQEEQKQPAASSVYEITLLEKQKFEGTDIMSFKFSKQNEQQEVEQGNGKKSLDYKAGQYMPFLI